GLDNLHVAEVAPVAPPDDCPKCVDKGEVHVDTSKIDGKLLTVITNAQGVGSEFGPGIDNATTTTLIEIGDGSLQWDKPGGTDNQVFDLVSGVYVPRFGAADTLT